MRVRIAEQLQTMASAVSVLARRMYNSMSQECLIALLAQDCVGILRLRSYKEGTVYKARACTVHRAPIPLDP